MKRILLRNLARERRLRRAMWTRAQGVPAEERVRHRLRRIWQVFTKGCGWFWLSVVLLQITPMVWLLAAGSAGWLLFFLSVATAGVLIMVVGNGLLIPRDGVALAHAPVSNRLSFAHTFLTFPLLLLFLWGIVFRLYGRGDFSALTFQNTLGWMVVPLLGVAWQCLRFGRAGPVVLICGVVGLVAVVVLSWIDGLAVLEFSFVSAMEAQVQLLPSGWALRGPWGVLAIVLLLVVTALAVGRGLRSFRFRAAPGSQLLSASTEQLVSGPVEISGETALETQGERSNILTKFGRLFWNEEERQLGSVLGIGYGMIAFIKKTMVLVLLLLSSWIPSFVKTGSPELELFLTVLGAFLVVGVLSFGWKSCVVRTAFSRFTSSGGRFVSVLAGLPISERMLFRMYCKEALLALLVTVSLQSGLIALLAKAVSFEMNGTRWLVILLFLVGFQTMVRTITWTRMLWKSLALFHPGIRGDLKQSLFFVPYCFGYLGWFIFMLARFSFWFEGRELGSFTILAGLAGVVLLGGLCWLLRCLYHRGRGSVIVAPTKKSWGLTR